MVPRAGLEPARSCLRGILNPLCLPIPPPGKNILTLACSHELYFVMQVNLKYLTINEYPSVGAGYVGLSNAVMLVLKMR